MSAATTHPSLEDLLDYWLGDGDSPALDAMDEHLMRCAACGERLDELIALGHGVRAAFHAGAVSAMASDAFVRRLAGQGLRIREYRLAHNGSVDCSVAPDDELLVAHLEAPLGGVERLDALTSASTEPGVQHRMEDVPFDPRLGEVLYLARLAEVRQMQAHTFQLTLLSVHAGGASEVGRYTLRHRPWPAL